MDPQTISPWLSIVMSAIALGTVIFGWFTAGEKKVGKDLADFKRTYEADEKTRADAIVGRFQLTENRLTKLEGRMDNVPDRASTHGLEIAMERLTGKLEVLEERLKPVDALSRRLQEILLHQATGKDSK